MGSGTGHTTTQGDDAAEPEALDVVLALWSALRAGRRDAALAWLDDAVEVRPAPGGAEPVVRGRAAFAARWGETTRDGRPGAAHALSFERHGDRVVVALAVRDEHLHLVVAVHGGRVTRVVAHATREEAVAEARTAGPSASPGHGRLRHEALLYDGRDDLLRTIVPFVREGLDAGEPVLAALRPVALEALREALGPDAPRLHHADMAVVGANPGRLMPLLHDAAQRLGAGGRRVRGIGEPAWSTRSEAELAECEHHEALVGTALGDADMWLLCPYDVGTLPDAVIEGARRTHPVVVDAAGAAPSPAFTDGGATGWGPPLPPPPHDCDALPFGRATFAEVRPFVLRSAAEAGLPPERSADLAQAVVELAANSVRHAGGRGTLLAWRADGAVVCEVRDRGRLEDPLAGRVAPAPDAAHGRGLWLANALCDLVQLRPSAAGTMVRVHQRLP